LRKPSNDIKEEEEENKRRKQEEEEEDRGKEIERNENRGVCPGCAKIPHLVKVARLKLKKIIIYFLHISNPWNE
jgi:hypothetical protein